MLKEIKKIIENNKNFLIIAHKNMEADALGSQLALARLLRKLGKKVFLVNADKVPSIYHFLPQADKVKQNIPDTKIDICFVLDCSDLERTGRLAKKLKKFFIVNIDHHVSNTKFGNINWIDKNSTSTCELIYRLYKFLKVSLDKESALCIYAGVLSDTGSFSFVNTSRTAHKISYELLKFGIDSSEVYQRIYNNFSLREIKFCLEVLRSIKSCYKGKIVYCETNEWKKNLKSSSELTEFILSLMRSIKDSEVAILFKYMENKVRINLRSKGKVDVNKVASFFGGGGHTCASAVTIKGTLNSVKKKVLKKIIEDIKCFSKIKRK